MWFALRPETLAFVDRAPVRWMAEADVAAPRAAVFAAVAAPESWKHWFPNVRDAVYTSAPPHGVGTIREAHVGGTRWVEEIIAWADGSCFAWTVTRASVPFAAAQVESFEFADAGSATRVRWTLALDPRLLVRLAAPLGPRVIGRLLRTAMKNLEAYLTTRSG
jgi:carbon monoxide dehydrogenase subunit G